MTDQTGEEAADASVRGRSRLVNLPPLMDIAAVAAYTGFTPGNIRVRLHRGAMPEPDGRIGRSPFWRRETVLAWAPFGRPGRTGG